MHIEISEEIKKELDQIKPNIPDYNVIIQILLDNYYFGERT